MKKLLLGLLLSFLWASVALAQNTQCSDRPLTDISNACANTRFVNTYVNANTPSTALKVPVIVATTANITLSGEQTIDGVLTSGSRVLVKDQTNAVQNGIYVSAVSTWTRSTDASTTDQIVQGTQVYVTQGTVNSRYTFYVTTPNTITIGTSQINWLGLATTGNLDLVADFHADPTGALDSTTQFNAWFAQACAQNKSMSAPAGSTFKLTSGQVWDFAACNYGLKIIGGSHHTTNFNFVGSGTCWQWIASGGTGPSTVVPYVYMTVADFTISCNSSGVGFKLGQDNGADVFESSTISNVYVTNQNATSGAIAIRINGSNANTWINLQCGVLPATVGAAGNGTCLQATMMAFNTCIGCSLGNANTAINYTDLGNSAIGFNYSNNFIGLDTENVQWGMTLTNANSASSGMRVLSGAMYTIFAGGYLFSNTQSGGYGSNGAIIVDQINAGLNPLYGAGGTGPMLNPSGFSGIQVLGYYPGFANSITVSASPFTYINSSGQPQMVSVTGGVMTSNTTYAEPGLAAVSTGVAWGEFRVAPGGSLKVTYSSAPSMYTTPMQ
jgi:uncharacterized cupin superfamily protein